MKNGFIEISVDQTPEGFLWRVWLLGQLRFFGVQETFWGAHREAATAAGGLS